MVLPILAVDDMAASLDFYTNTMAWTKLFSMAGDDGRDNFAMVSLTAQVQFGLSAMPAERPKGQGVVFMVYVADDVDIDTYYAQCRANGATISQEIKDEYWGDRCFGVSDPDGYVINVCKTIKQMSPDDIVAAAN